VEHVSFEEIDADATFRLREPGDVSELASAIGRLGQLTPVDLRPLPGWTGEGRRFQVVAGFRRLEALRLLQRDRVLARVHAPLHDDDAWALALAGTLFTEPWGPGDLDAVVAHVRERIPWAEPALAAARRAGGKEPPAARATPATSAGDLAVRAYELNGDLAVAYERWGAMAPEGRRLLLEQLRWLVRLFPLLEKETR